MVVRHGTIVVGWDHLRQVGSVGEVDGTSAGSLKWGWRWDASSPCYLVGSRLPHNSLVVCALALHLACPKRPKSVVPFSRINRPSLPPSFTFSTQFTVVQ